MSTTDHEADQHWLHRLYSLNAVVAAEGELPAGNLFYEHRQVGFESSPPTPLYRAKRDRLRLAVIRSHDLLEVGVNGGHSAYLALTANPSLTFHGVDLCEHPYVEPAVTWLRNEFPGRVFFHKGDSLEILPSLADEGLKFDLFHVDGAKFNYYDDILNSSRLAISSGSLVVVDDVQTQAARVAVTILSAFGVLARSAEFPPMPKQEPNRSDVRRLLVSSKVKWPVLKGCSSALRLAHRSKALIWRDTEWARAHGSHESP